MTHLASPPSASPVAPAQAAVFSLQDELGRRLARRIDQRGPDDCWPWRLRGVYGRPLMRFAGRRTHAQRFVWEHLHGAIPAGLFVCHTCDNGMCCNPAHLFLGTPMENVRDAVAKDRHAKGERIALARLTPERVQEIRALAASGTPHRQLARVFRVDRATIARVIRRTTWRHVG